MQVVVRGESRIRVGLWIKRSAAQPAEINSVTRRGIDLLNRDAELGVGREPKRFIGDDDLPIKMCFEGNHAEHHTTRPGDAEADRSARRSVQNPSIGEPLGIGGRMNHGGRRVAGFFLAIRRNRR